MNTEIIIQYLQIFGLTVFGIFFFILVMLALYLITVVKMIKKGTNTILNSTTNILNLLEDETQSIASLIKNKITSVDIEKIIFGSTIFGSLLAGLKKGFKSRNKTK